MVYPKVKVREQEDDDDFRLQQERNSLMLLKVFESFSSKVHHSPEEEHHRDSPPSVARIPKFYSPISAAPSISSSKGIRKNEKQIEEDTKGNIRASSVPRPRAVLSSPDNDGMIGHINQISRERPSVSKKNSLGENPHAQSKVNPRCVKARSPVNTRREPKETTDSKTYLNIMRSPDLTVPKQKPSLRKVKASSNEKLRSH